jgi:hypothetical protein
MSDEHLFPIRPGNWWVIDGKLVELPEGAKPENNNKKNDSGRKPAAPTED